MRQMTVAAVQQAIDLLEAIDPSNELAYEQAFLAYLRIPKLPVVIYNIVEPIEVFRARTHINDVFFSQVNEISLAPHSAINRFARCSRPFQSRFYGATNRPTAYMELASYWASEKEVGQHLFVTVGRWVVKQPFSALIVSSPDVNLRMSEYDKEHGAAIDDLIDGLEGEEKEATILVYHYLFDKFRKPAKDDPLTYIITTSYCNVALLTTPGEIDAIFYPSVPFGGKGVNFAFNNRFIHPENIELLGALRDEFQVYLNDEKIKSFMQVGSYETKGIDQANNVIHWKQPDAEVNKI
ncbi:RES domain-containing protein [Mucilaginibacter sp. UR6-1]|uniref:RES domain-containing protein n=1 Tax=Mucilaginibacter sp. UR6-1 TaxID=1435643 RepID=UPI001E439313|nr:RES domain-containing protein [Mucilaginibacter sp. UR6-1]MCC8407669.1 RES domain-containing protein [Mucilaginibacter sp. UR6-1]